MTATYESRMAGAPVRGPLGADAACAPGAGADLEALESWVDRAQILLGQGRKGDAQICLYEALQRDPDDVAALVQLARLRRPQDKAGAFALLRRARGLRPRDAAIFLDFMSLCGQARQPQAALSAAQEWLHRDPSAAFVHVALAEALLGSRQLEAALDAALAAIAVDPLQSGARIIQAQALDALGRHGQAVQAARLAFELRGGDIKARLCLAGCLASAGAVGEASAQAQRARAACDDASSQMTLARVAFFAGRYQDAWPAFEHRWAFSPLMSVPARPWRGEPVAGKTVLLVAEQGLGDSIQFARYAWEIVGRGGQVLLHLQDSLAPLFTHTPKGVQFASRFDPGRVDLWAPLLSAPYLLGMGDPMPAPASYVSVPAHRSASAKLAGPGMKVGLVWAGNPDHPNDHLRSAPLGALKPLLETPGVLFFALQKGEARQALTTEGLRDCITDLGADLGDWGDAAASLQRLDLLISVDSAPAHLAGALGRPVWTMLPFSPDWRWARSGVHTPWYRSMRLYRQARERDWRDPVCAMAADLAALAAQTARSA